MFTYTDYDGTEVTILIKHVQAVSYNNRSDQFHIYMVSGDAYHISKKYYDGFIDLLDQ